MEDGRRDTRPEPSGPARGETACWLVSGRVQGVGFRWFVAAAAKDLGLAGDVRNLPDGRVEVRARGGEVALGRLAERLGGAPAPARVELVERAATGPDAADMPVSGFLIRRGPARPSPSRRREG